MQRYTVLELGWGNYYAIPNDRLSELLKAFERTTSVDSMYVGNKLFWYVKDNPRPITMQLVEDFESQSTVQSRLDLYNANKEQENGA